MILIRVFITWGVTHDVMFDELAQWDWGEDGGTHNEINIGSFEI
jgi:hypothetical protein